MPKSGLASPSVAQAIPVITSRLNAAIIVRFRIFLPLRLPYMTIPPLANDKHHLKIIASDLESLPLKEGLHSLDGSLSHRRCPL
jgi:hypothetical protein